MRTQWPLWVASLTLGVGTYCPTPTVAQSQATNSTVCSTAVKCNEQGTAALRHGRTDEAIQLFQQQVAIAEYTAIKRDMDSDQGLDQLPCQSAMVGYNNLALAYFEKHDYPEARAWARVAENCDKNDPATRFNVAKIERGLSTWKWPQTLNGEYVRYAGRGDWQSFIVESSTAKSIDFCFSGLWWGVGEGPSGLGDLSDTAAVDNGVTVYSSHEFTGRECRIIMHFSESKLEVDQVGDSFDCGFGHNVSTHGTYQRISSSAKCESSEKNSR